LEKNRVFPRGSVYILLDQIITVRRDDMKTYQSYRNLPSLAGLCTMEEAMKPGLSVEQCVNRLKRYHYAFKRLHHILTAHITAEPIMELKNAFSLHAHSSPNHP